MFMLHPHDLYAGKLCAALDRQHPRDLFIEASTFWIEPMSEYTEVEQPFLKKRGQKKTGLTQSIKDDRIRACYLHARLISLIPLVPTLLGGAQWFFPDLTVAALTGGRIPL
jgi:hypothetical protein